MPFESFRTVRGSVGLLLAGACLTLAPGLCRAEQFVLFDVTFTYTKEDADNSKPSKSHYYVKGDLINKERPTDWTKPVDYRNGTVHIRTEILEKPAGGAPTTWTMCYIPNKPNREKGGYGCTGSQIFKEKGVYEKDVSMTSFWQHEGIDWTEGVKQMDLVIKDDSGGGGHAHKRADHEKFFPTKVRITMVQVSKGSKYDPRLVPNLPKEETDKAKDGDKPAAEKKDGDKKETARTEPELKPIGTFPITLTFVDGAETAEAPRSAGGGRCACEE
jgi:hypothetical protein